MDSLLFVYKLPFVMESCKKRGVLVLFINRNIRHYRMTLDGKAYLKTRFHYLKINIESRDYLKDAETHQECIDEQPDVLSLSHLKTWI